MCLEFFRDTGRFDLMQFRHDVNTGGKGSQKRPQFDDARPLPEHKNVHSVDQTNADYGHGA